MFRLMSRLTGIYACYSDEPNKLLHINCTPLLRKVPVQDLAKGSPPGQESFVRQLMIYVASAVDHTPAPGIKLVFFYGSWFASEVKN